MPALLYLTRAVIVLIVYYVRKFRRVAKDDSELDYSRITGPGKA